MIGTQFYKPLELDKLTRTITRTVEREEEVQVAVPVERTETRTVQEPEYAAIKDEDGTTHQIVVGCTPREVTETVQDIEYRTEKRTVTEEVEEQEEYDNPAPNTFTKYREAAQWCNANKARMVDCGDYYEVQALPEPTKEEERRAELERRLSELQEYLRSTDWYAIRFADSGVEIPAGVKQARQEARDEIDTLRAELEALAAAKA